MKIYLLSIDEHRCFFYADESESFLEEDDEAESAQPSPIGLKGRLIGRYNRLKSAWDHSESHVARWGRRTWEWLHTWSHPDEMMLVRLRSAHRIELHHPAGRHGDEVRALWGVYLKRRWRRHLFLVSMNTVITPFATLLAVLPGPNVIGYWFAYQSIHHALIVWGIRRVRKTRFPIELHPRASLDRPIEVNESGEAKHDALDGTGARLEEHVAWTESESTRAARSSRPKATDPSASNTLAQNSPTCRDANLQNPS